MYAKMEDTKGVNFSVAGIHHIINMNARFPGTYHKWQTQFCQPKNGWHGPCRRAMIFRTKETLAEKGGTHVN